MTFLETWLLATWGITVASAPWLLFGFVVAGLMHVLLPQGIVERFLQKPGFSSVLRASAIGIPLPLCSCSVIPVAVSLRRAGASRGSTASFLVSTPEIGVDSFFLSYVLLGPAVTVSRVIASFLSALGVGTLIDKMQDESEDQPVAEEKATSCCSEPQRESKLGQVLRYGFITVVDDLAKLLMIGFLLAGLVSALVPPEAIANLGFSDLTLMLAMLLVSLPVYVCATSSTPLAAVLLAKGLNPGAALVFLLAGPATNVTTMLVVRDQLGGKALAAYLFGIISIAFAAGFALNSFVGEAPFAALSALGDHAHQHFGLPEQLAGLALLGLIGASILRNRPKLLRVSE